jgi:hypothetical protein
MYIGRFWSYQSWDYKESEASILGCIVAYDVTSFLVVVLGSFKILYPGYVVEVRGLRSTNKLVTFGN